MRKAIYAAVLTASVIGLSSSAFAVGNGYLMFGPTYEQEVNGHMMHMQVIADKHGAKFVVLPMEDAEMMFGPINHGAYRFK